MTESLTITCRGLLSALCLLCIVCTVVEASCMPLGWEPWTKVSLPGKSCYFERIPSNAESVACGIKDTVRCTSSKCSGEPCSADVQCAPDNFCGMHVSGKRDPTCCPMGPKDANGCKPGKGRECRMHSDCGYLHYCLWDKMNKHSTCCEVSPDDIVCPLGPEPPYMTCWRSYHCGVGSTCTPVGTTSISYCCKDPV